MTRIRKSITPIRRLENSSDSSDDDEMIGNVPRLQGGKTPPQTRDLLSQSVRSASFNIVFQVLLRVFTFGLNIIILRYISHEVLGICNVRLALLYSSLMFLSREPFRRASLRVPHDTEKSWKEAINFMWFAVPNTGLWSLILGFVWCFVLSLPADPQLATQYQISVCLICISTLLSSLTEAPYIIAQYFLYYKIRIIGETVLIVVRSLFLFVAVVQYPDLAVFSYSFGSVIGTGIVCLIYYGYFYTILKNGTSDLPFKSIQDFLPSSIWGTTTSNELKNFTWSFYKQGILKQLLTEGERYLMTLFDLLSFDEQGVYDVVSNLGSLAARFVFQPIEESSYHYFAQSLQRRCIFKRREKDMAVHAAHVLSSLVRLMMLIGITILVFGIPYSRTVLYLYGGQNLSEGPATGLLQANCIYIFIMAINGITETFTFAAMSQKQMDEFNKRLVLFSGVFLISSVLATKLVGCVGFYIANTICMSLRVAQSVKLIQYVFLSSAVDPFADWFPKIPNLAAFGLSFFWILLVMLLTQSIFVRIGFGLVTLLMNGFVLLKYDHDLIAFFMRLYKTKTV